MKELLRAPFALRPSPFAEHSRTESRLRWSGCSLLVPAANYCYYSVHEQPALVLRLGAAIHARAMQRDGSALGEVSYIEA